MADLEAIGQALVAADGDRVNALVEGALAEGGGRPRTSSMTG